MTATPAIDRTQITHLWQVPVNHDIAHRSYYRHAVDDFAELPRQRLVLTVRGVARVPAPTATPILKSTLRVNVTDAPDASDAS